MVKTSSFVIALLQLKLVTAFTQCYYPDGSIPQDYLWEACEGTKHSSCCVPSEGDVCQPSGLCYFPPTGNLYRGACTDRTWDDPACHADVCVTGFETTWMWVAKCDAGGAEATVCGSLNGTHEAPTCASGAVTNTASIRTRTPTTAAGRYTPPPSLDPSAYSIFTSTYTTKLTATVQTTTQTTTFESTFTRTIAKGVVTGTSTASSSESTTSGAPAISTADPNKKAAVVGGLSTGTLILCIALPVLAILIGVALFLFFRRRRIARNKGESIRLNSAGGANHPPPNGPVGADQVYPYEVDINEASGPRKEFHGYKSPKLDAYEIDDRESDSAWSRC